MANGDGNLNLYITAADLSPYILVCFDCQLPFRLGDQYCERLEGMVGEVPVVEIVCGKCGMGMMEGDE